MSKVNALVIGASQGIGLGFVRHLLKNPQISKVYATYRSQASASGLLSLAQESDRVDCLATDSTEEAQIAACCEQIKAAGDRLHWVINCVGILHEGDLQPEKALRQLNADHLTRYFQVNSIGPALWAKHLMPLLKHPDRSVLATISAKIGSIGDNRLGGWYGYRASKAALNMFMKTASIEYRRRSPNTIVVTLHPGTTDTKLSEPFQRNVPPDKLFSVDRTVTQLLAVLEELDSDDSGQFFSWDSSLIPW
ncbi:MAG: SDR family NAD(P)-dependent oxidoreductase [Thermosynechococcaceae cyanobacterium]